MIDLEYKKSGGPWPLQATAQGVELNFSGSLDSKGAKRELAKAALNHIGSIILWALAALGVMAFILSFLQGLQNRQWLFFLDTNLFNLIFWVTAFTSTYLWAKTKQAELQETAVNVLHWETLSRDNNSSKLPLDVYSLFDTQAKKIWNLAIIKTVEQNPNAAEPTGVSVFLSLLEDPAVRLVFARLGVRIKDMQILLNNYVKLSATETENLSTLPFLAFAESVKMHNPALDPLMLLCALVAVLPEDHIIQDILFNIGVNQATVEVVAAWILNMRLLKNNFHNLLKLSKTKPDNEINVGLTSVPTLYLDSYATDLTWKAKHGALPVALGRAVDLHNIFGLLSQGGRNIVIKGPPGAGRTTLLNELAYKMAAEQVPKILQDKRLLNIEIGAIVGNKQKTENVFLHLLKEAARDGNIILVIKDLHALSKTQTESGLSLLELLINFMQHQQLLVLATTTVEDYTAFLRPVAGFEEAFSSYELTQLSSEDIILACCIKASLMENKEKVFFRFQSIEQAVSLTDIYIRGVSQPQKAVSVLVEAAARAKNNGKKFVTKELIQQIVSEKTHIPSENFNENEADKLLNLEEAMSKYIVGQKEAITAVAESLRRARSGVAASGRPLSSFLFLGPTGVGKTEVAKTLAAVYFGEEKYLLRLDMSEYQGAEGLAKLLGVNGSKTDSELVKHIKNYPFCLLLMDEFEKASKEIHNIFLEVLEDGRLTTGNGETLDVTHCLIIATSNAGAGNIQAGLASGKTLEQIKQQLYNQILTQNFSPELLNRFDGIILFSPLSRDEVRQVTLLQLEYLKIKLKEKGIRLDFTDSVINDIAINAYDPSLGARPIRRYIQDHVEGLIAKLLLSRQLPRGSTITIDFKDGKLQII